MIIKISAGYSPNINFRLQPDVMYLYMMVSGGSENQKLYAGINGFLTFDSYVI